MSFWTDIRDAVTEPFRAAGSFAEDVISGRNVFESLGDFGTREFFALNPMTAFNAPVVNNTPIKDVLDNKYVSSLSAGLSSNISNVADFTQKSNTGADFSFTQARDAYLNFAEGVGKVGAATLALGAAPASAGTFTQGAAAYTGAQGSQGVISKLQGGDFLGAFSSASGLAGAPSLPDGFQDTIQAGKDAAAQAAAALAAAQKAAQDAQGSSGQAGALVQLAKQNTPSVSKGYSSTVPGDIVPQSGSMTPLLIGGGILAVLLLMKGRK